MSLNRVRITAASVVLSVAVIGAHLGRGLIAEEALTASVAKLKGQTCGIPAAAWASPELAGTLREIASSMRALGDSAYSVLSAAVRRHGTFESAPGVFRESAAEIARSAVLADPNDYRGRILYGELLFGVAPTILYGPSWRIADPEMPLGEAVVDTITLGESIRQLRCGKDLALAAGISDSLPRVDSLVLWAERLIQATR